MNLDANDADSYFEVYARSDLNTPITVTADSAISMSFDFDTQSTVIYESQGGTNDTMYFTPPQSGTQFQITVDGTTTTITEADMRIDF